uniref:hypothetical protein n=1 Tax=Aliarcobacter sp. TaxID=2321116 RepID=UPI0040484CDF
MKNSFSLLEIILTLIISSIVIIYSSLFTKELYFQNKNNQNIEIAKIDMLSTKIFLDKNKKDIDKIDYKNENLYFKNSLLLENVKEFKINKDVDKINIHINFDNKIIQDWIIIL